jgi:hypothetical protein
MQVKQIFSNFFRDSTEAFKFKKRMGFCKDISIGLTHITVYVEVLAVECEPDGSDRDCVGDGADK